MHTSMDEVGAALEREGLLPLEVILWILAEFKDKKGYDTPDEEAAVAFWLSCLQFRPPPSFAAATATSAPQPPPQAMITDAPASVSSLDLSRCVTLLGRQTKAPHRADRIAQLCEVISRSLEGRVLPSPVDVMAAVMSVNTALHKERWESADIDLAWREVLREQGGAGGGGDVTPLLESSMGRFFQMRREMAAKLDLTALSAPPSPPKVAERPAQEDTAPTDESRALLRLLGDPPPPSMSLTHKEGELLISPTDFIGRIVELFWLCRGDPGFTTTPDLALLTQSVMDPCIRPPPLPPFPEGFGGKGRGGLELSVDVLVGFWERSSGRVKEKLQLTAAPKKVEDILKQWKKGEYFGSTVCHYFQERMGYSCRDPQLLAQFAGAIPPPLKIKFAVNGYTHKQLVSLCLGWCEAQERLNEQQKDMKQYEVAKARTAEERLALQVLPKVPPKPTLDELAKPHIRPRPEYYLRRLASQCPFDAVVQKMIHTDLTLARPPFRGIEPRDYDCHNLFEEERRRDRMTRGKRTKDPMPADERSQLIERWKQKDRARTHRTFEAYEEAVKARRALDRTILRYVQRYDMATKASIMEPDKKRTAPRVYLDQCFADLCEKHDAKIVYARFYPDFSGPPGRRSGPPQRIKAPRSFVHFFFDLMKRRVQSGGRRLIWRHAIPAFMLPAGRTPYTHNANIKALQRLRDNPSILPPYTTHRDPAAIRPTIKVDPRGTLQLDVPPNGLDDGETRREGLGRALFGGSHLEVWERADTGGLRNELFGKEEDRRECCFVPKAAGRQPLKNIRLMRGLRYEWLEGKLDVRNIEEFVRDTNENFDSTKYPQYRNKYRWGIVLRCQALFYMGYLAQSRQRLKTHFNIEQINQHFDSLIAGKKRTPTSPPRPAPASAPDTAATAPPAPAGDETAQMEGERDRTLEELRDKSHAVVSRRDETFDHAGSVALLRRVYDLNKMINKVYRERHSRLRDLQSLQRTHCPIAIDRFPFKTQFRPKELQRKAAKMPIVISKPGKRPHPPPPPPPTELPPPPPPPAVKPQKRAADQRKKQSAQQTPEETTKPAMPSPLPAVSGPKPSALPPISKKRSTLPPLAPPRPASAPPVARKEEKQPKGGKRGPSPGKEQQRARSASPPCRGKRKGGKKENPWLKHAGKAAAPPPMEGGEPPSASAPAPEPKANVTETRAELKKKRPKTMIKAAPKSAEPKKAAKRPRSRSPAPAPSPPPSAQVKPQTRVRPATAMPRTKQRESMREPRREEQPAAPPPQPKKKEYPPPRRVIIRPAEKDRCPPNSSYAHYAHELRFPGRDETFDHAGSVALLRRVYDLNKMINKVYRERHSRLRDLQSLQRTHCPIAIDRFPFKTQFRPKELQRKAAKMPIVISKPGKRPHPPPPPPPTELPPPPPPPAVKPQKRAADQRKKQSAQQTPEETTKPAMPSPLPAVSGPKPSALPPISKKRSTLPPLAPPRPASAPPVARKEEKQPKGGKRGPSPGKEQQRARSASPPCRGKRKGGKKENPWLKHAGKAAAPPPMEGGEPPSASAPAPEPKANVTETRAELKKKRPKTMIKAAPKSAEPKKAAKRPRSRSPAPAPSPPPSAQVKPQTRVRPATAMPRTKQRESMREPRREEQPAAPPPQPKKKEYPPPRRVIIRPAEKDRCPPNSSYAHYAHELRFPGGGEGIESVRQKWLAEGVKQAKLALQVIPGSVASGTPWRPPSTKLLDCFGCGFVFSFKSEKRRGGDGGTKGVCSRCAHNRRAEHLEKKLSGSDEKRQRRQDAMLRRRDRRRGVVSDGEGDRDRPWSHPKKKETRSLSPHMPEHEDRLPSQPEQPLEPPSDAQSAEPPPFGPPIPPPPRSDTLQPPPVQHTPPKPPVKAYSHPLPKAPGEEAPTTYGAAYGWEWKPARQTTAPSQTDEAEREGEGVVEAGAGDGDGGWEAQWDGVLLEVAGERLTEAKEQLDKGRLHCASAACEEALYYLRHIHDGDTTAPATLSASLRGFLASRPGPGKTHESVDELRQDKADLAVQISQLQLSLEESFVRQREQEAMFQEQMQRTRQLIAQGT
ncbi:unnamed protein product [Vitrella brassicaformis CCMP3155]|uniref:Uncharacterized protein n=1 Tax=Vitrella brassicaformis (strain CCMP3155) TaxID=1169540 RepID=A0A0G4GD00_VITBC|nr:unnamed protein product [Vitrella brassicaformis CCMP3155]|eukprot:CEM27045.1 unnamed protein product [Vitrella brassicaformis CCMP3155]